MGDKEKEEKRHCEKERGSEGSCTFSEMKRSQTYYSTVGRVLHA